MADNVAITAGSGTSIATDDISSVQYQRVKMGVGGDGKYSELQPVTNGGVSNSTTDTTVASSSGILFGVSFFSTEAAGVGRMFVMDSTSGSTGNRLAGVYMSTGAGAVRSDTVWFGPQGVKFTSGLRVVLPTTVTATVRTFYISPA